MRLIYRDGPASTRLTTLARVKADLGLTDTNTLRDAHLDDLIAEASDAIVAFCDRPFARAAVTELLGGTGRHLITVALTPVKAVEAIRFEGDAIDLREAMIYNDGAGFLYRTPVYDRTPGWSGGVPDVPAPDWETDYIGGYLLPDDNLTLSAGTIVAASGVNTYQLAGAATFPILVSGETVVVAGFGQAANNGRQTVLARTPTVLTVVGPLVTETASGVVTVESRTLPRDLERACVATVRDWYYLGTRDANITQESLGDWSASYATSDKAVREDYGLPTVVAGALTRWSRPALA